MFGDLVKDILDADGAAKKAPPPVVTTLAPVSIRFSYAATSEPGKPDDFAVPPCPNPQWLRQVAAHSAGVKIAQYLVVFPEEVFGVFADHGTGMDPLLDTPEGWSALAIWVAGHLGVTAPAEPLWQA